MKQGQTVMKIPDNKNLIIEIRDLMYRLNDRKEKAEESYIS